MEPVMNGQQYRFWALKLLFQRNHYIWTNPNFEIGRKYINHGHAHAEVDASRLWGLPRIYPLQKQKNASAGEKNVWKIENKCF